MLLVIFRWLIIVLPIPQLPTPAPSLSPKPLPSLLTHSNLAVRLPIYICCSDHLSTSLSTNLPEPPTHSNICPCINTMKCLMFTSECNTTNNWTGIELNTIMWLLYSDWDSYTGNKSIEGNWGLQFLSNCIPRRLCENHEDRQERENLQGTVSHLKVHSFVTI